MTTYGADLRAGDIVRGADGGAWEVRSMDRASGRLAVTLARGLAAVTGYPPAGTQVEILARASAPDGTEAEIAALAALSRFGPLELLGETWNE